MKKIIERIKTKKSPITQYVDDYVLKELGEYAKEFGCTRSELIRRILRETLIHVKYTFWCDRSRTKEKIKKDVEFVLEGLSIDYKKQILKDLLDERNS